MWSGVLDSQRHGSPDTLKQTKKTTKIAFFSSHLWGSVAGSMAALQVGISQYAHTAETFHISFFFKKTH